MNSIELHYDASTEGKIFGKIVEHAPLSCGSDGLLRVPMSASDLEVILGPSWFMKAQDLALLKQWPFEVTGSLIHRAEKDCFLVREIVCNGQKIFLRDPFGQPLWRTWVKRLR